MFCRASFALANITWRKDLRAHAIGLGTARSRGEAAPTGLADQEGGVCESEV